MLTVLARRGQPDSDVLRRFRRMHAPLAVLVSRPRPVRVSVFLEFFFSVYAVSMATHSSLLFFDYEALTDKVMKFCR